MVAGDSDPVHGWPPEDLKQPSMSPTRDIHGRLFFAIQDKVKKFCERLQTLNVTFEIFSEDITKLFLVLGGRRFDRINVRLYLI